MRALRQRLGDVEAARRPQHPARLGERAFKLGAGHMMQREHEEHEIGFVVRFGKRVGHGVGETEAAGALLGQRRLRNERIVAGDAGALLGQGARQVSLAAADVEDAQPAHGTDRRQQRIEMRQGAEVAGGSFCHGGDASRAASNLVRVTVRRA